MGGYRLKANMSYKEFRSWCNQRCCDGYWGFNTIVTCAEIHHIVLNAPFWKREKIWRELNDKLKIVENIVEPINKKIGENFKND